MKVFCLYNDGNHVDCFPTLEEAEVYIMDGSNGLGRYADIEEEDYTPECDCGNQRISEEKL